MRLLRDDSGQATVGFAVALPAALVVALVSFNALMFFSECARFDRLVRNAVRICAVSPGHGQSAGECAAAVESMVEGAMGSDNLVVMASVEESSGFERYEVVLEYEPTLFGLPLKGSVFGIELFRLKHMSALAVDSYDPSVLR